ncbi:calpain-13-like [Mantella aurantiaca]
MNTSGCGLPPRPRVRNGTLENPRKFFSQDFNQLRENHLRKGTLFVDEEFPANLNIIGSGKDQQINMSNIEWRRPKEIVRYGESPQLIVDGTSLFDMLQSERLGDCWFICAMGALTLKPNLLQNIMPRDQQFDANYAGIFHFRLWHLGEWVEIVVDDLLPFLNGKFLYVRPSSSNEFWPCLLEKAYAKLMGSYQNLHWGFPEEAFVNLTGGITMSFDLRNEQMKPTHLWHMINGSSPNTLKACVYSDQEGTPRNRSMSVPVVKEALDFRRGSEPISHIEDNPILSNGLVQSHAYSITATAKVETRNGSVKLIRLWNPWGYVEWKGAWNDKSPIWRELRDEDRKRLQRVREDGEFWMSWEDFSLRFSRVILCNHIPDFLDWGEQQRRWYRSKFWNRWNKDGSYSRNPQYMITVMSSDELSKGYNAIFSLMQSSKNRQKIGGQWLPIGLKVLKS